MNILPDCLSIHQIIGLDGLRSQQKTPCPHYAAEDTEQDHRCECIERNGGHETQPEDHQSVERLVTRRTEQKNGPG